MPQAGDDGGDRIAVLLVGADISERGVAAMEFSVGGIDDADPLAPGGLEFNLLEALEHDRSLRGVTVSDAGYRQIT
jgi:hypothetical protein